MYNNVTTRYQWAHVGCKIYLRKGLNQPNKYIKFTKKENNYLWRKYIIFNNCIEVMDNSAALATRPQSDQYRIPLRM